MPDEPEIVDAEPVGDAPAAEIAEAVTDALGSEAMVVVDRQDPHEGFVAMDAHDAARLIERLTMQAQEQNLGKRWVYELPNNVRGLTIDAVQDIVQGMNWTGRCRIGILPGTLEVETVEADEGDGPETFWTATIAAEDGATGAKQIGTSMEPQRMKLRDATAAAKRREGKKIPDDNKVFDRFSRAKAVGKAQRNAMEAFIPEVVKLTLIAMAAKKPELVERIETPAEAKVRELPPPLDTPEATKLIAELGAMYDGIRELGGGRGRVLLTPGQYNAYLVQSQHSMELLSRMKGWLEQRRDEIRSQVDG